MIDIDRKSSGNIKLVKLIRSMKCYVIDNVINVKKQQFICNLTASEISKIAKTQNQHITDLNVNAVLSNITFCDFCSFRRVTRLQLVYKLQCCVYTLRSKKTCDHIFDDKLK